MLYGLFSGVLWGIDTVILGIALAMSTYVSTEQAIFLAPFISTFLHDLFSSIWMMIYMTIKGELANTFKAIRTRSGKFIVLGALMGGPIGMTGYVLAIKSIGPAYTAIISSLYPAFGALLSYIFLKEKMKLSSIFGLLLSILGIIILGYAPVGTEAISKIGFIFALVCVVGWASEAVIGSYGMKDEEITPEQSLQVRQFSSAVFYGIVIIPIIKGISFTVNAITDLSTVIIIFSALAGTVSYVCYYKGIHQIGATRAMALNITYSAWSIVFGVILIGSEIDLKSILCCIMIILGSVMAAGDISEITSGFFKGKSTKINEG